MPTGDFPPEQVIHIHLPLQFIPHGQFQFQGHPLTPPFNVEDIGAKALRLERELEEVKRENRKLSLDKERLDYLESELDTEQKRIAEGKDPGTSVFRMNQPITRTLIDANRPF